MASPNYSELLSLTMQKLEGELADSVTNENALMTTLKKYDMIKTFDGGPKIVQPLEYAGNGTYSRYSGYESVDITPSDAFTAAEYAYKQVALSISASGLELLQNSGSSQVFDLLESRIMNAKHTFENNFHSDCLSDGTASSGKQIGGLQLALATNQATGTVGGINKAIWSFWRANTGTATLSSSNIQATMNALWLKCKARGGKIKVVLADDDTYGYYESSLQNITRLVDPKQGSLGRLGFSSYAYKDAEVVYVAQLSGMPNKTMYFIDPYCVALRPHKDRNFTTLNPDRHSVNQDAVVKLQAWAGNVTYLNMRKLGVLYNS